jgi:hypothetical protein
MNIVEKLFEDKAIFRSGIMFLTKENALLFVEACEKNIVQILGIDAFYLSENIIQPSMENSVDFSSSEYVQKSENIYSEALNFLTEKSEKLFFEIVCMD